MKRGLYYLPTDSAYPFKGLEVRDPSTMADPRSFPVCENMSVFKGHVSKRKGWTQLGATLTGVPIGIINWKPSGGVESSVVITTTNMYKWTGSAWSDISPKQDKIRIPYSGETGVVNVGDTVVQKNTGATGKVLAEGGGNVDLSVIIGGFTTSATNLLEKTAGVNFYTPSGAASTLTANGGDAKSWTGTEDDVLQWTVAVGVEGTWLIVTNGKDEVSYWDGARANFTPIRNYSTWKLANFVTAKTVTFFNNHLLFGNVTTLSNNLYSIYWSNSQSLTKFEGVVSGTSGSGTIGDVKGQILTFLQLGDRLAYYTEEGIGLITYVGGDEIFRAESLLGDTRLNSARSVMDLKSYHVFMAKDNINAFDGTRQEKQIGDSIQLEYREKLSSEYRLRSFAFADRPKSNVYFITPVSATESIVYFLDYNPGDVGDSRWSKYTYAKRITAMGFYSNPNDATWDSPAFAGRAWSSLSGSWDQASAKKGFSVRLIGFSDGIIGVADDTLNLDGGVAFSGKIETKDFVIPQIYQSEFARWLEEEIEARGGVATIEMSTDQGATFSTIGTKQLLGHFEMFKLDIDKVSKTARFRISSTEYFEVRVASRVWYHPVGAR